MRKIPTLTAGVLALVLTHHTLRARQAAVAVTAVSGPSWLHRLGVDIRETNLGRGAGRYGQNPNDPVPAHKAAGVKLDSPVTISGGDLYRLNCQACHRVAGTGAAPDVKSLLPMVQGSSQPQMTAALRHQATQTRADLYTRIEKGGQRMPPREYLQRSDIDLLYSYLRALAGGGTASARRETISVDRLGEFVVKGTCHICHDATGPRPTAEAILVRGSIPSLSSLLAEKPIADFVDKVRTGASISMGNPPLPHRGRMPVFYYLTDAEIVAAYTYLSAYPPK
jgi:mono/diheme cytochrome c family protein